MLKWGPYPITQYRGFPGVVVVRCPGAGSCRCPLSLGVGRWALGPFPFPFPLPPLPLPLPASRFPLPLPLPTSHVRFPFPFPSCCSQVPVPVQSAVCSASASAMCHHTSYIIHQMPHVTNHQSPKAKTQKSKRAKEHIAHATCNTQLGWVVRWQPLATPRLGGAAVSCQYFPCSFVLALALRASSAFYWGSKSKPALPLRALAPVGSCSPGLVLSPVTALKFQPVCS
jgi:hypothetical protein